MRRIKGFTLLELIIVLVILGVLATLGLTRYGAMVERARGAEARAMLGTVRTMAAAYNLELGSVAGFNNAAASIGTGANDIPSACAATHFFSYGVTEAAGTITITATRCTAGGKTPNAPAGSGTLTLAVNFPAGTDVWGGTGNY